MESTLSFYERLERAGLSSPSCRLLDMRKEKSMARLSELSRHLKNTASVTNYPNLSIYAAGSHARGEASEYSDIDLWFMREDSLGATSVSEPNIKSIELMADIVRVMKSMDFPSPSNDGEFLKVLSTTEILTHLGGSLDDYRNHFTARMLLMLESYPVYGADVYHNALGAVVDAYLRDYEDHAENFRPTFLVNDILRYWKTLCLNYEHRRNQVENARKIKQKIKNFKLGYSRLLTCFATVAILSNYNSITKDDILNICNISPIERLLTLLDQRPGIQQYLISALILYEWFLQKTEMSPDDLESYFSDRENRVVAFNKVREFGDQIYQIIKLTANDSGTLRYLVI